MTELRLFDNTRISDFRRCPRYYFFRHIRHWKPGGPPSNPLAFGGAWHDAMDTLWTAIHADMSYGDTIEAALEAWTKSWVNYGMPHPKDMGPEAMKAYSPRTPVVAHEMLIAYYQKRHRMIKQMEIIEIERPFAVPLSAEDDKLFYVGRIDKVVAPDKRSVRGIEHKTTTSSKVDSAGDPKIRPVFAETFSPNSQVDGYLYTLHLLYPDRDVDVWVDAALVSARGEDFQFIPIQKKHDYLDQWLWTTHYWIDQIERNNALLFEAHESDRYLSAFPQDTSSCFDFNTQCAFLPLCKSRANPLSWGEEAPQHYITDVWDPLDHIGTPVELL